MKALFLLSIVCILYGCKGGEVADGPHYLSIYYKDDQGRDLLNPNTLGHFSNSDIKIYDVGNVDNVFTKVPCPPLTGNSFVVGDGSGRYCIRFGFSPVGDNIENFKYTLIELNSSITDSLFVSQSYKGLSNYLPDTIYYQSKPLWTYPSVYDIMNPNSYKITIVHQVSTDEGN